MYRQRQYVANTSVNFSDFRFFVKPGDLCRHHEDTGDFIVFRNGELLAKLKISLMALRSMMTPETQFFTEIKATSHTSSPLPSPSVVVIEEPEEEIITINEEPEKIEVTQIEHTHSFNTIDSSPLTAIDTEDEVDEEAPEEEESTDEVGMSTRTKKKRKK